MAAVAIITKSTSDISDVVSDVDTNPHNVLSLALTALRLSKTNLFATDVLVDQTRRRIISLDEVSNHDTADDCWIVLYDRVYNVTEFLDKVNLNFFPKYEI